MCGCNKAKQTTAIEMCGCCNAESSVMKTEQVMLGRAWLVWTIEKNLRQNPTDGITKFKFNLRIKIRRRF
jgi:uncharacterized protein YfaT (DUF1175 family)